MKGTPRHGQAWGSRAARETEHAASQATAIAPRLCWSSACQRAPPAAPCGALGGRVSAFDGAFPWTASQVHGIQPGWKTRRSNAAAEPAAAISAPGGNDHGARARSGAAPPAFPRIPSLSDGFRAGCRGRKQPAQRSWRRPVASLRARAAELAPRLQFPFLCRPGNSRWRAVGSVSNAQPMPVSPAASRPACVQDGCPLPSWAPSTGCTRCQLPVLSCCQSAGSWTHSKSLDLPAGAPSITQHHPPILRPKLLAAPLGRALSATLE